MGYVSHERFLLIRSASPGAFVKNRQDDTQVGDIDYARRYGIHEVRILLTVDRKKPIFNTIFVRKFSDGKSKRYSTTSRW